MPSPPLTRDRRLAEGAVERSGVVGEHFWRTTNIGEHCSAVCQANILGCPFGAPKCSPPMFAYWIRLSSPALLPRQTRRKGSYLDS